MGLFSPHNRSADDIRAEIIFSMSGPADPQLVNARIAELKQRLFDIILNSEDHEDAGRYSWAVERAKEIRICQFDWVSGSPRGSMIAFEAIFDRVVEPLRRESVAWERGTQTGVFPTKDERMQTLTELRAALDRLAALED